MGVRQLQTFIQKYVPNGYIEVSLYDECEAFKRRNNVRPIVVIDLMGTLRPLIKCNKELLCGLRHNEIYKILEDLFIKLSSIAELIFYEDGPVNNIKLKEWMRRQTNRYETSIRIINKIKDGIQLDQIVESEKDIPSQTSHLRIAEQLARKYGTLIFSLYKECDAEMAQFACKNSRVLAIIGDDSDFLIYPGQWRYFSFRELNKDSLVTMEYSRRALREFLNLNDQELILLATLNGNDVIQYEELRNFHRMIKQGYNPSIRFPELANFISNSQFFHSRDIYGDVANVIFGRKSNDTIRKVRESFEFYDINFRIPEITDNLLRYCHEKKYTFVYSVLNYMLKTFTLHYFDLRESGKYTESTLNLFCKQIGIILKFKPRRSYEICARLGHNDVFRVLKVDPIYPQISIPPLLQLLNRSNFMQHDNIRFNLLKWLINEEKLRNVNFTSIPKNILLDILCLSYIVSEGFIDTTEADLVLLSIKHVNTDTIPQHLEMTDYIHPRAFFISFLFSKSHMHIGRCLEVTGLDDLNKVHNFDGVLFHHLYNKHQSQPIDLSFLLRDLNQHRYYAR